MDKAWKDMMESHKGRKIGWITSISRQSGTLEGQKPGLPPFPPGNRWTTHERPSPRGLASPRPLRITQKTPSSAGTLWWRPETRWRLCPRPLRILFASLYSFYLIKRGRMDWYNRGKGSARGNEGRGGRWGNVPEASPSSDKWDRPDQ